MGASKVREFTTVDGVVDAPMWTIEYGFPDDLVASIGQLTASATGILLGRTTFEMFALEASLLALPPLTAQAERLIALRLHELAAGRTALQPAGRSAAAAATR
jgi:hypothetical protein